MGGGGTAVDVVTATARPVSEIDVDCSGMLFILLAMGVGDVGAVIAALSTNAEVVEISIGACALEDVSDVV